MMTGGAVIAQPIAAQAIAIVGGDEVLTRSRPGLEAIGFRVGGFRINPSVVGTVGHDDNIYDVADATRKSAILSVQPKLSLQSDWPVHQLAVDAQALIERYPSVATENNNQYGATVSGRIDASRGVAIEGMAHADRAIEARGTAGDVVQRGEPIHFSSVGGSLQVRRTFDALLLQAGIGGDRFTYKDVRVGATTLDLGFRDRDDTRIEARVGYQVGPGVQALVQGSIRRERYDENASAILLDANERSLLGGVHFDITRLITGEVSVGYMRRKSRNDSFAPIRGLAYQGAVTWNPSTLITVKARARKSFEASPSLAASSVVTNSAGIDIDYEILRRLLASVRLVRVSERYAQIDRRDRRFNAGIGLNYALNRFAEVGARYNYRRQRGAGLFGRDYNGNDVRLTITVRG